MNPQEQAVARSWAALTDTAREAMHRSHAYRALADALDGLTDRGTGDLVEPYHDRVREAVVAALEPAALQRKLAGGEALEFSHSLDAQIGGQLSAGFVITGFYEDRWFDDSWLVSNHCPVAMATKAIK